MAEKKKQFIDSVLLTLFVASLLTTFFSRNFHAIAGILFLFAVLIHNAANKKFYRTLGKGNSARKLNYFCTTLFGASIILLTISGAVLFFPEIKFLPKINWLSIHLGAAISSFGLMIVHLLLNASRYIRGGKLFFASIFSIALIIGGAFGLPYVDRWYHKVEVNRAEIVDGEKVQFGRRVLTVYFSRVGNTNFPQDVDAVSGASIMRDGEEIFGNAQMIALMVQDATGSDLLAIKTALKYPASYSETTKIAREEFSSSELPALDFRTKFDAYDKIILIYPLWWGTLPKPVESFVRSYHMKGKILIPIVTHGGGGIGDSVEVLKKITDAKVTKPLDIYSSDVPSARQEITNFLNGID